LKGLPLARTGGGGIRKASPDIEHLLEVTEVEDFPYWEFQHHDGRSDFASRWALLEETDRAFHAMYSEEEPPSLDAYEAQPRAGLSDEPDRDEDDETRDNGDAQPRTGGARLLIDTTRRFQEKRKPTFKQTRVP
jgi:hypothetical protein